VLQIFIALKNPSSWAGFEPADLRSSDKHDDTRPPRTTAIAKVLMSAYNNTMLVEEDSSTLITQKPSAAQDKTQRHAQTSLNM
jgi:hypothetical protein